MLNLTHPPGLWFEISNGLSTRDVDKDSRPGTGKQGLVLMIRDGSCKTADDGFYSIDPTKYFSRTSKGV